MLIQVIYPDNHHDFVKPSILDTLIESGTIMKFRRSSGWVTVGTDPVRKSRRSPAGHLSPYEIRRLSTQK